jgi:hypothetical protein
MKPKAQTLSVVINTKNVAETLTAALESVKEVADQIVVVDMHSTDDTLKIAKKYTKDIFTFEKDVNYVEPARNFAINKARGEWILILDADEEASEQLVSMIKEVLSRDVEDGVGAFFIPRKNLIFGKWLEHTGWWPDYQLRLFKQGTVVWSDEIHSVPEIKGKVEYLPAEEDLAIVHHNYPSVESYLARLNRYTTVTATGLTQASGGDHPALTQHQVWQTFTEEFLRRYFAQEGWKDGVRGMSLSLLQGMYEVSTQLKVWEQAGHPINELGESEKALSDLQAFRGELAYWIADTKMKESSGLTKLVWQVRRKLRV